MEPLLAVVGGASGGGGVLGFAMAFNGGILARPAAVQSLQAGFAGWMADLAIRGVATNQTYGVGALTPPVIAGLKSIGREPVTAAILARDVEILHALRGSKASSVTASGKPKALTLAELTRLPTLLGSSQAVLLSPSDGRLLYVYRAARREAGKIVVTVNFKLKTEAGKQTTNAFQTAALIDLIDLKKEVSAGNLLLLEGTL